MYSVEELRLKRAKVLADDKDQQKISTVWCNVVVPHETMKMMFGHKMWPIKSKMEYCTTMKYKIMCITPPKISDEE